MPAKSINGGPFRHDARDSALLVVVFRAGCLFCFRSDLTARASEYKNVGWTEENRTSESLKEVVKI